jgi:hypothetical protein
MPRNSPRPDEAKGDLEAQGRPADGTKADPPSEVASKRRIETQVRDALGDRLRSVEVRVTGRNVLIVVKPSHFWHRRSIRRTLESLPVLDGYRVRIDVAD